MKKTRNFILAATLLSLASSSWGQVMDYSILPESPSYKAAAEPLRNAPPGEFKMDQARLSDILQLLAEESGISYFSLPEDAEAASRIVTFTIHASPFLALEKLCESNGIALIYDNGIWYMRPENDTHLIARSYEVQYNPRESISTSGGDSSSLGSVGGATGGGASGGGASSGIDLQGGTQSFTVEPSQLLDDVKELLDIPTSATAVFASAISTNAISTGGSALPGVDTTPGIQVPATSSATETASNAKVIWDSDTNSLYVVATRQQHSWIEGYLANADKPQDQIAIEVKFFETSKDPQREFGIDWTGTLGDGYDVNIFDQNDTEGLDGPLNLQRIGDYMLPTNAILSLEDVSFKIHALLNDSETKTVSYPRMVVTNNREVMFRSVVNQPVLASSSSSSLGAGATSTQAVSYLPIGTVLNILPKRLGDGNIQLNIALTVSSIIGTQIIDGNPYPIASSRVYNAPVEVHNGYTVAIGGLDAAKDSLESVGVPAVSRIPVLRHAFQKNVKSHSRSSLMIFITPTVVDTRSGGLPDEPQSVVRQTPHDPAPPTVYDDGSLALTLEELPEAIMELSRELEVLENHVEQSSATPVHRERSGILKDALKDTRAKVANYADAHPEDWDRVSAYQWELMHLQQRLNEVRRKLVFDLY